MANINSVFGGGFLKAEDLQGRNVKVKINKVEVKQFDDGDKLIVHFEGKDKALVCNKTNASIIAEVTGKNDTDDWLGESIWLVTKKVEFQGKLVPAIRVALEQPTQAAPTKAPAKPAPPTGDGGDIAADDVPF